MRSIIEKTGQHQPDRNLSVLYCVFWSSPGTVNQLASLTVQQQLLLLHCHWSFALEKSLHIVTKGGFTLQWFGEAFLKQAGVDR